MSHTVVITQRTTTTSSGSSIMLNTGYLKTLPGLLKLAQLILGAVAVGLVGWYFGKYNYYDGKPELFFLLMAVAFLIGTFCLLTSCLISFSTGGIISKTAYELIYHSLAFLLYLIAAILLLVEVTNKRFNSKINDAYMAASVSKIMYFF